MLVKGLDVDNTLITQDNETYDVCDYSMTKGVKVTAIEKCGVEGCMKKAKWPGKILQSFKPILLCETHALQWRKEAAVTKNDTCVTCGKRGSIMVRCNFDGCNRLYHVTIPCLKGRVLIVAYC